MAQAPTAPLPPWSQRVLDGSPLSPFWTGVLLALGFLVVFFVLELALGRFAQYGVDTYRQDLRVAIVLSLVAGYGPAAWLYSVRGAQRTLQELSSALRPGARTPEAGHFEPRMLRRAGFTGIAVLVVSLLLIEPANIVAGIPLMSVEAVFHRVLLLWIGWFAGRFVYATVVESRRFSQLGREGVEVDLLDLSPLSPLIRQGLRQALVTIGGFSLVSLMFYDLEAAPNLVWFLLVTSVLYLALAATVLLVPVRGVHDAIAREKARELARVNDQIRRARDQGGAGLSLADWVAYRGLVESVREWPVDAPTLRRFALYLVIPLGSWFGGALVERMVDTLLG